MEIKGREKRGGVQLKERKKGRDAAEGVKWNAYMHNMKHGKRNVEENWDEKDGRRWKRYRGRDKKEKLLCDIIANGMYWFYHWFVIDASHLLMFVLLPLLLPGCLSVANSFSVRPVQSRWIQMRVKIDRMGGRVIARRKASITSRMIRKIEPKSYRQHYVIYVMPLKQFKWGEKNRKGYRERQQDWEFEGAEKKWQGEDRDDTI